MIHPAFSESAGSILTVSSFLEDYLIRGLLRFIIFIMPTTNYYMNAGKNRNSSPSKRWQTTMKSSLDEVASQLEGNYDRAAMVKDLKDRKISNTKTSISFGNEKVSFLDLF
jgi:hypothetical protein